MLSDLELLIKERSNNHRLNIHTVSDNKELELLFKHRYMILRNHKMINKMKNSREVDEYDYGNCIHVVATFDGRIIGGVRMIYGDILPMRDIYFSYNENGKKLFLNEKIFEVSRLASAPHNVTNLVPRHLVLLAMLYYVTLIAQENRFTLAIGATKGYVFNKFKKIHYPLFIIENCKLIYDFESNAGPLKPYFEDHAKHQILPTYSYCDSSREFLRKIFENNFVFSKIDESHLSLKSLINFNLLLMYKMLF